MYNKYNAIKTQMSLLKVIVTAFIVFIPLLFQKTCKYISKKYRINGEIADSIP